MGTSKLSGGLAGFWWVVVYIYSYNHTPSLRSDSCEACIQPIPYGFGGWGLWWHLQSDSCEACIQPIPYGFGGWGLWWHLQNCGGGTWYRIAHLNMSDPSQQCPPTWRNYNTSGVRACGRQETQSCSSTTYITGRLYSKVCGRVIGYQVVSPDAFHPDGDINQAYADGVSITYGQPRTHIWSYVGGYTDFLERPDTCPCTYSNSTPPPEFVGDNYYCESANKAELENFAGQFFAADKLWDGQQCDHEGACCIAKSPPWFSVELPHPILMMILKYAYVAMKVLIMKTL